MVLVREIVTVVVAISLSQMSRVRYAIRCQRIPRLYSYHILNLRTVVQSVIQGVYLENHRTQTSMTLVLSVKLVITNSSRVYIVNKKCCLFYSSKGIHYAARINYWQRIAASGV